jgi:hypothetical protein
MAKNPYADRIRNNTNRRRQLMNEIRSLRESKQREMASIDSSIRCAGDVNYRRSLRSQKANTRDRYNAQIERLRDQCMYISEENRSLRCR